VKERGAGAPADIFESEEAGLAALRASGTSLVVPEVLGRGSRWLALEWLEGERGDEEDLGIGLASLHRATAAAFGFSRRGYCGMTPQDNTWTARWPEVYRDRRLAPLIARIADRLAPLVRADLSRLLERVEALLGDDEPPALIHGDLWSGNWLPTARGPAVFDPAAHYAHRETELGMCTWFGGFSRRMYEAYESVFPLAPGWRERNPLYRLYHVLNHAVLFGESYDSTLAEIARRFSR